MKKMIPVLLFVGLISGSLFGQWTAGTKSVGSLFSYSSSNSGEDGDKGTTEMSLTPSGGYFIMDNVAIMAVISITSMNDGNETGDAAKAGSMTTLGAGGRYHMGSMYAGGAFMMLSNNVGEVDPVKGNMIMLGGGYLHPLADGIYLDCALTYTMGMGKWKMGSAEMDNKSTEIGLAVGVSSYF